MCKRNRVRFSVGNWVVQSTITYFNVLKSQPLIELSLAVANCSGCIGFQQPAVNLWCSPIETNPICLSRVNICTNNRNNRKQQSHQQLALTFAADPSIFQYLTLLSSIDTTTSEVVVSCGFQYALYLISTFSPNHKLLPLDISYMSF